MSNELIIGLVLITVIFVVIGFIKRITKLIINGTTKNVEEAKSKLNNSLEGLANMKVNP